MKKIVKIYLSLIIAYSNLWIQTFAQSPILIGDPRANKCVSVDILESSPAIYKAKIRINKLLSADINRCGNVYQEILFDDTETLQNIGEPALPVIIQHIGLPQEAGYSVDIVEGKWLDMRVGKIYPKQIPQTSYTEKDSFYISDSVYKSNVYNCSLLDKSDIMRWKGIENVYLTICPFKYYPSINMISILSEFTLVVNFHSSNSKKINNTRLYEKSDLSLFDNKNFITETEERTRNRSVYSCINDDYLIIVGNIPSIENSQAMKDFCRWKALKGYKTKVVSTSVIGSDSASIKNYIYQQYLNGIRRVLFIGTQEKIPVPTFPARQCTTDHPLVRGDYWYGCLDGNDDIQGDLPIARFVTNNLMDFSNVVNKTIKYESLYHEWANRILLVSHATPGFQEPLDTIYNLYNPIMNIYKAYAAPVSQGGTGSNILDVIDYINNGMNLVTVNTHGNAGGFWLFDGPNSTLFYSDTGLFNNDTYSIIFSNACNNGDFTNGNSIMNNYIRSDHCATAFVGSTVASFIAAQNRLTKKMYNKLLDDNLNVFGNLLLNSHISNLSYNNSAIDNAFSYIYGGDPALELWTGNQGTFDDVNITLSGNSLYVNTGNVYGFDVNVVSETGELLEKHSSSSNNISIPTSESRFDLAINKYGYIPYVVHIDSESHYIQNVTLTGNVYYFNTPITVGYNATTTQPYGNVILESGSSVNINKGSGVTIENGFECKTGATFSIK